MADPRTMEKDGISRRWDSVAPVTFCPACLGALPPDTPAACSTCGRGVRPAGPRPVLDEQFADDEMAEVPKTRVLAEESYVLTKQRPTADSARRAWWQRFARWPNA